MLVYSALLLSSPVHSDGGASSIPQLEAKLGVSLTITSGYRPCDHPLELKKGHCNGTHARGIAYDVSCGASVSCVDVANAAKEIGYTGVIRYPRHVHVDTRETPYYSTGKY